MPLGQPLPPVGTVVKATAPVWFYQLIEPGSFRTVTYRRSLPGERFRIYSHLESRPDLHDMVQVQALADGLIGLIETRGLDVASDNSVIETAFPGISMHLRTSTPIAPRPPVYRTVRDLAVHRPYFQPEMTIRGETIIGAVSDEFLLKGWEMSKRLGIFWPDLLMVMNLESGISSHANNHGVAFGLIQEQHPQADGFHGTNEEFLSLSNVEQLPFVENFLRRKATKNLDSEGRIHQALFVPATLDHPDLFPNSPNTIIAAVNKAALGPGAAAPFASALVDAYHFNRPFDREGKGFITVGDLEKTDRAHANDPRFGAPYQQAIARLRVIAPQALDRGSSGAGIGAVPWLAVGTFVALGVGAAMLADNLGYFRLPKWTPRWMRTA